MRSMDVLDSELELAGVLFLPWIGDEYEKGFEGVRLLILGESHYDSDKRDRSIPDRDVTRAGICWYIEPETHFKFATHTQQVVNRRPIDIAERKPFWNSIAFYNYVQSFAGLNPRDPVTLEMWQSSRAPFEKVLEVMDPQAVVVLGYKTWAQLQRYPEGPQLPDREGLGECPGRGLPTQPNRSALAFHTMHPSGPFSARQWYNRVAAGIRVARELSAT